MTQKELKILVGAVRVIVVNAFKVINVPEDKEISPEVAAREIAPAPKQARLIPPIPAVCVVTAPTPAQRKFAFSNIIFNLI